jgi:ABC-2 type transport system permease protein
MTARTAHLTAPYRRLARTEAVLFLRTPVAVTWTALLPVIALIALASVPALRKDDATLHGLSYLQAYLPILMGFSLCMSAVNLLPPNLALYREKGVLRRLSTTPVPPSALLLAQAGIFAAISILVSLVMLGVGAAYGVALPRQPFGFALSLLLTAGALVALGILVAAVATTGKAANALAMVLFFPLMFFAGLWVPRPQMPETLRTISDYTPLGAGVQALQDSTAGHWPTGLELAVLLTWAVICSAAAARLFRWE